VALVARSVPDRALAQLAAGWDPRPGPAPLVRAAIKASTASRG
jgi:hypothetical protein